jgi:hypothetical protein
LWAYDLLDPMLNIADPTQDTDGLTRLDERVRASRAPGALDNDF